MSTRSDIIVCRADRKWHRVYCHFDGYLEGVGRTLFEHYNSQERADELIAPGDMSTLDKSCEKPAGHSFTNRLDGYTVYYGRDRGEKDVAGKIGDSLMEVWPEAETWTEFTYVWADGHDGRGVRWFVGDPDEGTQTLIDLADALSGKRTLCPNVKAFGMVIGQHLPSKPDKPHSWTG